jgi:hypothetical protein
VDPIVILFFLAFLLCFGFLVQYDKTGFLVVENVYQVHVLIGARYFLSGK